MVEKAGFSRRTRRTFEVPRLIIFTASCSVTNGVGASVLVLAMLVFLLGTPCTQGSPLSPLHRKMLRRTKCLWQRGRHCWSFQLDIRPSRCSPRSPLDARYCLGRGFDTRGILVAKAGVPGGHVVHTRFTFSIFPASCCVGKGGDSKVIV